MQNVHPALEGNVKEKQLMVLGKLGMQRNGCFSEFFFIIYSVFFNLS